MKIKCTLLLLPVLCILLGCNSSPKVAPDLSLGNGQICTPTANGEQNCLPLNRNQAVVLKRNSGKLSMSPLGDEELVIGAADSGIHEAEIQQFRSTMREKGMLYDLPEGAAGLNWDGTLLKVLNEDGGLLDSMSMDMARGFLLLQSETAGRVSMVGFGTVPCEKWADADSIVSSQVKACLDSGQDSCPMIYGISPSGTGMVMVGGGLSIILVDPAIIDHGDHLERLRLSKEMVEWLIHSVKPGPGEKLMSTLGFFDPKDPNRLFPNVQVQPNVVSVQQSDIEYFQQLEQAKWVLVCQMETESVHLWQCKTVFYVVNQADMGILAILDYSDCPCKIVRKGSKTLIYRPVSCQGRVKGQGCMR
ncbi:MAG: hypothetical protein U0176_13130 [Bacteroidia bacterium]